MPWAFKKDAFFPRCIADGMIGYSAEGIADTWKVLTKTCSHDLSKMVDPAGTDRSSFLAVPTILERPWERGRVSPMN